jgi:hypothetical protein
VCELRTKQKRLENLGLDQPYESFFDNVGNTITKGSYHGVSFNNSEHPLLAREQSEKVLEDHVRSLETLSPKPSPATIAIARKDRNLLLIHSLSKRFSSRELMMVWHILSV